MIFFNSMLPPALTHEAEADETDETMSWTKTSMTHSLRLNDNKNRVIRNVENVKRSYDSLEDTALITVSVIHITFCRHATSNTVALLSPPACAIIATSTNALPPHPNP